MKLKLFVPFLQNVQVFCNFYEFLLDRENEVAEKIESFLSPVLEKFQLDHFVCDVYCEKEIKLVDFGYFGGFTDHYLKK